MSWGQNWNSFNWGALAGTNPTGPAANRQTPGVAAQENLLGKDILFKNDYSITKKGDYVLIDGIEALRQAILHRLITRPGEFRTRPTYGVGIQSFVKKRKNPANIQLLRQRIKQQVARESRVEEVLDIAVTQITDGVKVSIAVRASGKSLRFRPFVFNELGERTLEV